MSTSSQKTCGAAAAFFGLVVCALSITTIVLISTQLYPGQGTYSVYYPVTGTYTNFYLEGTCLMTTNSVNVCRYGYSVGAIGALAAIASMAAMCAPAMVTLLISAFQTVWFLAWSITATVYSNNLEGDDSLPQIVRDYHSGYRRDVYAMAWTCFALSIVSIPLALAMKKSEDGAYAAPAQKNLPGEKPVTYETQPAGYPAAVV